MATLTYRQIPSVVSSHKPFTGNSLRGETNVDGYESTGKLPVEWVRVFRTCAHDYVLWSYGTPIAWVDGKDVTIPPVRYSNTTSRHQSIARYAL